MATQYTGATLPNGVLPTIMLAPPEEFIPIGGSGTDWGQTRARMGTQWLGLHGTFGTILSANFSLEGDIERKGNGAGVARGFVMTGGAITLEMEVQHDRGLPTLRKLDRLTAWCDIGFVEPRQLVFHIEEVGADKGDGETASLSITARHEPGFSDRDDLIRAVVDPLGRVIAFDEGYSIEASLLEPGLPPAGPIVTSPPGGNTNPAIGM